MAVTCSFSESRQLVAPNKFCFPVNLRVEITGSNDPLAIGDSGMAEKNHYSLQVSSHALDIVYPIFLGTSHPFSMPFVLRSRAD